ncbi:dTDP-4-dehydrorhamnose reductase [Flavobacteriaceae bacterium LMO-SS05]
MKTILVTGGHGQLAKCIKDVSTTFADLKFIYTDQSELDITRTEQTDTFFNTNKLDWCINCAAYTAVDRAETEQNVAFEVNTLGPKNLALACKQNKVGLMHISTDFVFDGTASKPYSETDKTNPLGVYGLTKLEGEQEISSILNKYYIIRTSWLYSEHGNNFLKTMLRLAENTNEIKVVSDQIGSPTYAKDLALLICKIISRPSHDFGTYNYSNEGIVSWYDFAKAIFEIGNQPIKINPISTEDYPTLAKRPKFSVLDTTKIKHTFGIQIPHWKDSLKTAISKCNE